MTFRSICLFINRGNFVARVADWTNDIFSQRSLAVRDPDWPSLEPAQTISTKLFVDKNQ